MGVRGSNPFGSTISAGACPIHGLVPLAQPQLPLPVPSKPLGDAITALLAAKAAANLRLRYLDSLRVYLRAFARGREDWPVAALSVCTVEAWFAGRTEALTTRKANMGRLASLFTFCVRRGWLARNPCEVLDKIRLDPKPPRILSVAEARTLLVTCQAQQCGWPCVALAARTVRVDAVTSKVRNRRSVMLSENAAAWLALGGELPVVAVTRRRWQRALRGAMGWPVWPQDILRHTAASYALASGLTTAAVSDQLGNSPAILKGHYREICTKAAALEFFGLLP